MPHELLFSVGKLVAIEFFVVADVCFSVEVTIFDVSSDISDTGSVAISVVWGSAGLDKYRVSNIEVCDLKVFKNIESLFGLNYSEKILKQILKKKKNRHFLLFPCFRQGEFFPCL